MKLLLLFLIGVTLSCALTDEQITSKWNNFKRGFNRQYADQNEENQRKQIFIERVQKIEEHNKKYAQGLVTYKQGINQFTDRTNDEIKGVMSGFQSIDRW